MTVSSVWRAFKTEEMSTALSAAYQLESDWDEWGIIGGRYPWFSIGSLFSGKQ